ncbi:hypothetical protein BJV74DRAFT_796825 [Russula compacta]|nr:hypothetical protein BJV74DRAFT_796825 [Russula compacta]
MYSEIAQEEDNKLIERYQKDADAALIFDISAFYLENIYQLLAIPNASNTLTPSTLARPPVFSPPSLAGALVATLGQEWAHRYTRITQQSDFSPEKRARIRAIFANSTQGAWGYYFWGQGRLAFYLHSSVFLYIAGAIIYLFNTDNIVFSTVVCWVSIFTTVYAVVTVEAIFKPDILFYTPASPLILRLYLGILYAVIQVCSHIKPLNGFCNDIRKHFQYLGDRYREGFLEGQLKATETTASKTPSGIDAHVLEWTFGCLVEDYALEKFFRALPGFFGSNLVNHLAGHLSDGFLIKFGQALIRFLDHTFSSHSVSELARSHPLVTCLNAARAALGLDEALRILDEILNGRWGEALQSTEVGHFLRRWSDDSEEISSSLRRIVARIVSRITLVKDEFDIPDRTLRDNLAHGDSALLAILIHFTRRLLHSGAPSGDSNILREFSHIDIHSTLPGLRHNFCILWNEIVQEARRHSGGSTPILILKEIRHLYIALHQGTDAAPIAYSDLTTDDDNILLSPLSYPPCDVVEHRLDSTDHLPVPVGSQSLLVASLGVAAADASQSGANISTISGTAIPSPHPIPGAGGTHILVPAPSCSAIPAVLFTSKDSTIMRTDYIPHSPGTPSSFSTDARLSMPPQVATVLGQSAAVSIGTAGVQDGTREQSRPTSMEFFGQQLKSAPSASDIATNTSRREGHQDASVKAN